MKRTLSILIPAYNEETSIKQLVELVLAADIRDIEKQIILVDDGSDDDTIRKIEHINEVQVIRHPENLGKGCAIRTGIAHCRGQVILIQDADLEYDPNDYWDLIQPVFFGEYLAVYGSRRLKSENKQHSGFRFYLGGLFLTFLTNLLYPTLNITDEPTCYKVFDASLLKSMNLQCKRFEFCPEVTAKLGREKISILEVPISYYPRSIKEGKKISWIDGIQAIWTLVKYRFAS